MTFKSLFQSSSRFSLLLCPILLTACGNDDHDQSISQPDSQTEQVAFMADVHFHDIYGDLKSSAFKGIATEHGNATIRTMYAELTSTRLFNENYFAFRAALDSALAKGIKIVAFPGDFSDDGQPMNVDGFKKVLAEYQQKGMRFFIAPGNHDPVSPEDNLAAGKNDFMGMNGQAQKVYALENQACLNAEADIVCTNQMMEQGYASLMTTLGEYGFMPNKSDVYWETPYSTYTPKNYNFTLAQAQSKVDQRQYEICKEGEGGIYKQLHYTQCATIPDASYLVEPVPGLWLLSVDANVYIPTDKFDPNHPNKAGSFSGAGNAGWNKMVSHKQSTMKWIADVSRRAKLENKKLVAFSHYPTMEFYANQTKTIQQTFGNKSFQTERVPLDSTTSQVAATGLPLHIGGHMHSNSSNEFKDAQGHYLVNIQSPSLAVYGAAYKIVKFNTPTQVEVETVKLDDVPRFNELFPLYKKEHDYIVSTTSASDPRRWNIDILKTKSYQEFTHFYFGQLSQLRFMKDYWPCDMRAFAEQLNLAQMLTMTQLKTNVSFAQLAEITDTLQLNFVDQCFAGNSTKATVSATQFSQDWAVAESKARKLTQDAGLSFEELAQVTPYMFYGDFHRTIYAGGLALDDMGKTRVEQYKLLMRSFPEAPALPEYIGSQLSMNNPIHIPFQYRFKNAFSVLKGVGSGKPSNHFKIDFDQQTLTESGNSSLSFH